MMKIVLLSGVLIALGVVLRRTQVLNTLKNSLFDKVDSLTGTSGVHAGTTH